jgi:tetratricopeptide (TPR) repeat protein
MKWSGFLVLLVPLILSGGQLQSQPAVQDADIRKAFLNLDNRTGNDLLSRRSPAGDAGWIRLAGLRDFLDVLLHQSLAGSDLFSDRSDVWLKSLEKAGHVDNTGAAMVELHLYRAVLASQFSNYKTAAVELIASNKALARSGPEMSPFDRDKLSGILGVIFRQVPPAYMRYLKLAGIRPASLSGFNGLEHCYAVSAEGSTEQLESYLLLLTAHKEFNRDPSAAWLFAVGEEQPMLGNPLVRYQSALAARKAGKGAEASALLDKVAAGDASPFPYWLYQVGRNRLYANATDAVTILDRFLASPGGDNYRHSAMLMTAWYYRMNGRDDLAAIRLAKVRSLPEPLTPYDKQALNEAVSGNLPDQRMLTARLLFDGGNYHDCLQKCIETEQAGIFTADGALQADLFYRRARCEQRLGMEKEALVSYLRVTGVPDQPKSYILPYSALQAGHLYKKAGQYDLARKYYTMCLGMNRYGYREGISREAELALKELDK